MRPLSIAAILLLCLVAGCASPAPAPPAPDVDPRCVHPWPCADGTEWPTSLLDPFPLGKILEVRVPMDDGVELAGGIFFPDVPEGTRLPLVIHAMPYGGQCYETPTLCAPAATDPAWLYDHFDPMGPIVHAGYALANINVRGTGDSGGCFDFNGERERKDLALLVEALAREPWSNGRAALFGMSYMGTTPWLAASEAPPSLKTIVPMGIVSQEYTYDFTPQGAGILMNGPPGVLITSSTGIYPALGAGPEAAVGSLRHSSSRACPEVVRTMANFAIDPYRDARDASWYAVRDHAGRLGSMTASVFVLHGLQDNFGHTYQEDVVWDAIPSHVPKRMALGQWSHVYPDAGGLSGHPDAPEDWAALVLPWLDFWLKGLGTPKGVGLVEYGDTADQWRADSSWPPKAANLTALRLMPGRLAEAATQWETSLIAAPAPTGPVVGGDPRAARASPYCDASRGGSASASLLFSTDPMPGPVVVAGNPFAILQLESNAPRGLVAADLYDIGPMAECTDDGLVGGRWVSAGAADLRFHEGNLVARDFPTDTPTEVRIDLFNLAHHIEAGNRLVLVVSGYGEQVKTGASGPYRLAVRGTSEHPSEVVLPIVEGILDGAPPRALYPPRPFAHGPS